MIRGTTPTMTFRIQGDVDLSDADNVYLTIQHGNDIITKTGADLDIDENKVSVWLSQEETLALHGFLQVQINWTYTDDATDTKRRAATRLTEIKMERQLLNEVIE